MWYEGCRKSFTRLICRVGQTSLTMCSIQLVHYARIQWIATFGSLCVYRQNRKSYTENGRGFCTRPLRLLLYYVSMSRNRPWPVSAASLSAKYGNVCSGQWNLNIRFCNWIRFHRNRPSESSIAKYGVLYTRIRAFAQTLTQIWKTIYGHIWTWKK